MVCPKCGGSNIQHVIFFLRCVDCAKRGIHEPISLPKGDTTGVDFLVERYTQPTPENTPGQDIEFVPLNVNQKG